MKNCYVCQFTIIDNKCEMYAKDWHKEATIDMNQKINQIKTKRADLEMRRLIF